MSVPASNGSFRALRASGIAALLLTAMLGLAGAAWAGEPAADQIELATRYAAAWSGGDPAALAAFYAEDGRLVVNDGEPATGREAVEARAAGFMEAFPDMVVRLVKLTGEGTELVFHWHWTGTNTGPGGTGLAVDLPGYEEWTLGDDGLILESRGHYDEVEYQRQMSNDAIFQ